MNFKSTVLRPIENNRRHKELAAAITSAPGKSKVEIYTVQIVVDDKLLIELDNKPFQKLEGSRRSLFESLEKPLLKPLPGYRYEFARWKKAVKAGFDTCRQTATLSIFLRCSPPVI